MKYHCTEGEVKNIIPREQFASLEAALKNCVCKFSSVFRHISALLSFVDEVRVKVIFSQVPVCLQGGRGVASLRSQVLSEGIPASGPGSFLGVVPVRL